MKKRNKIYNYIISNLISKKNRSLYLLVMKLFKIKINDLVEHTFKNIEYDITNGKIKSSGYKEYCISYNFKGNTIFKTIIRYNKKIHTDTILSTFKDFYLTPNLEYVIKLINRIDTKDFCTSAYYNFYSNGISLFESYFENVHTTSKDITLYTKDFKKDNIVYKIRDHFKYIVKDVIKIQFDEIYKLNVKSYE